MAVYPAGYSVYTVKLNADITVAVEAHNIPASPPYVVTLLHPAKYDPPKVTVTISGFAEVHTTPQAGQFDVDYMNMYRIIFNSANAGQPILVTYLTKGDLYVAGHINDLQDAVVRVEHTLGLNPQGGSATVSARIAALEGSALLLFADQEVPSGTIDGANPTFQSAQVPLSGSDHLFRNGVLQLRGTNYTIAGKVITYFAGYIPQVGDAHRISYRYV